MKCKIITHTGAGSYQFIDERIKAANDAADIAYKILKTEDDPVKAVVEAIKLMEDVPECDAGTGSGIQLDGIIRMDAGIMDSNMKCGGVLQIQRVKNPIEVAKIIYDKDFHVYLSGEQATQFARQYNIPDYNPIGAYGEVNFKKYISKLNNIWDYDEVSNKLNEDLVNRKGTVGAVAINSSGMIVAATSTGGMEVGYPGRIGDSAIFGAGTYANKFAGLSATGVGEKIIKLCLTKTVYDYIKLGMFPKDACEKGINELGEIHGDGGLIAIDNEGNIGYAFNTETMPVCIRE